MGQTASRQHPGKTKTGWQQKIPRCAEAASALWFWAEFAGIGGTAYREGKGWRGRLRSSPVRVGASVAAGVGLVPQLPQVMIDRPRALCLALRPQPGLDIAMMGDENSGVLQVAFIGAGAQKRAGFLAVKS